MNTSCIHSPKRKIQCLPENSKLNQNLKQNENVILRKKCEINDTALYTYVDDNKRSVPFAKVQLNNKIYKYSTDTRKNIKSKYKYQINELGPGFSFSW